MRFKFSKKIRNERGEIESKLFIIIAAFFGIVIITGLAFAIPTWNVWRSGMSGEAALKRAEQTRQILVTQAKAEKEAAQLRADAISIVGKAAKEFPEYRQQEFLGAFAEALKDGKISQIMYVPTEANIPVTEASRLARKD